MCERLTPSEVGGDERSVGHGVFEHYPSVACKLARNNDPLRGNFRVQI